MNHNSVAAVSAPLSSSPATPTNTSGVSVRFTAADRDAHLTHFDQLAAGMRREGALLHPSPEELATSYRNGEAVLALAGDGLGHAVGYVRLEPLLTPKLMRELGVTRCPEVMESGSFYVSRDGSFRGQGHLKSLCHELFATRRSDLDRDDLLVIGTTKHLAVLRALERCEDDSFVPCNHLEYPHVAALTCVCAAPMGTGFYQGTECSWRISSDIDLAREGIAGIPRDENGGIPCTMFVSNRAVAAQVDAQLAAAFADAPGGSVEGLRQRLLQLGFYRAVASGPTPATLTVSGMPV